MKEYRPIATINNYKDIIKYFPFAGIRGHEANTIIMNYLSGATEALPFHWWDEETFYTVEEAAEDKSFVLTTDGKYGVRFTCGDAGLLRTRSCQHGYYIDIYETVDYKKNNMEKSVEMEENSAKELHRLISTVLDQPESKDTCVMVEKSNGELIPVSYVWYDRQQDIIRICYEEDEE